jgi:hypothetical protein
MKSTVETFAAVFGLTCAALAVSHQAEMPTSPKEITELLEKRWSLKAIEDFCTPERRWNPLIQNLVPDGDKVWRGKLYDGKPMPFDEVSWYAGVAKYRLEYSLKRQAGQGPLVFGDRERQDASTAAHESC